MLEATLNTQYTPGTNLKGDVTGANWMYLLPSLELSRVAIVGVPRPATLRALARVADHVLISLTSRKQLDAATRLLVDLGISMGAGVEAKLIQTPSAVLDAIDVPIALLLLADGRTARAILNDTGLREAFRVRLKPGATVYFETRGQRTFPAGSRQRNELEAAFGPLVPLWLTPLAGEMHTAVPVADTEMIDEMLERGLDSRFVSVETIRAPFRRGRKKRSEPASDPSNSGSLDVTKPASTKRRSPARRALRPLSAFARNSGHAFVAICQKLERQTQKSALIRRHFGRTGNHVGAEAAGLLNGPPRYLREIAAKSNIDISNCRWGFAAAGEYSSRKMLFLLFDRDVKTGTRPTPRYLVKMTRDSQFNARLERECAALRFLEAAGLGADGSLPRAIFAGSAGKLAVVGESFIEGVPFDARSKFSADCPLTRSAVEWLTRLGETTADMHAADPEKIAEGLRFLVDRFATIYSIDADERRFLDSQLEQLASCPAPIPLVFQHGDPGRWNVFATANNRAVFLDWESAEHDGLPLWDLFYFLRSFSVGVSSRVASHLDVNDSFDRQVLNETPIARFFVDAVNNYSRRVGLPAQAIEPLFHTCWMHRAVKESTRLPAASVRSARYFQLFQLCMRRREAASLKRLFSSLPEARVLSSASAAKS